MTKRARTYFPGKSWNGYARACGPNFSEGIGHIRWPWQATGYVQQQEMSKIILVFGATGAQGRHVVNSLLAPSEDGSPSPYTVRALTRNPEGKQALALREKGVELVRGKVVVVINPRLHIWLRAEDIFAF
jgi:hypothetical protein